MAKSAPSKKVLELLELLDEAMSLKDYDEVERLLADQPHLIHDRTPKCEVPLVMAIKHWDPRLVCLCIKHGANPKEEHVCSKDSKPKHPILIAFDEFTRRLKLRGPNDQWEGIFNVYASIMSHMEVVAPFQKGCADNEFPDY